MKKSGASIILFISITTLSCKNDNDGTVSCYTATKNNVEETEKVRKNIPVTEVTLEKLNENVEVVSTESDKVVHSEIIAKPERNIRTQEVVREQIFAEVVEQNPNKSDHQKWNNLLRDCVSPSGNVNYKLLNSKRVELDNYLAELSGNEPSAAWSWSERLAYHINLYNAQTVALIINNYPVKSIKDINGGDPWDVIFIPLGGKKISLNHLEHEIIRPTYKDARVHFALNCASESCPKLLDEAYTAGKLESQLEKQTRIFLNNPSKNNPDPQDPKLSKLFKWYKSDFGNVIAFVNRYLESPITSKSIDYLDYSWRLNE